MNHLEDILALAEEKRTLVLDNIIALQLTEGCTVRCDFCQIPPPAKIKATIPFTMVERIVSLMSSQRHQALALYFESDPFDYDDEGKTIIDVMRIARQRCVTVRVTTAIPRGKEELVEEALDEFCVRISTTRFQNQRDLESIDTIVKHPNARPVSTSVDKSLPSFSAGKHLRTFEEVEKLSKWKDFSDYVHNIAHGRILNAGIIAFQGVVLTPLESYNITMAPFSLEYPRGYVKEPLRSTPASIGFIHPGVFPEEIIGSLNSAAYMAWLSYPDGPFPLVYAQQTLSPMEVAYERMKRVLSHPDQIIRKVRKFMAHETIQSIYRPHHRNNLFDLAPAMLYLGRIGDEVRTCTDDNCPLSIHDVLPIYHRMWSGFELFSCEPELLSNPCAMEAGTVIDSIR